MLNGISISIKYLKSLSKSIKAGNLNVVFEMNIENPYLKLKYIFSDFKP